MQTLATRKNQKMDKSHDADNLQALLFNTTEDNIKLTLDEAKLTLADVKQMLSSLKDWYLHQPHLPEDPFDDDMLLRLCATSKFSSERTKEKIDNYLTARNMFPEFFGERNPRDPTLAKALECLSFTVLPEKTDSGYRVLYSEFRDKSPEEFDPIAFAKVVFMISDLRIKYETVLGDVYVWNLKHFKLGHVTKLHPALVKKIFFLAQKCYGSRIKGIYVLNMEPYAESAVNILKNLLKKKIADRIHICSGLDELQSLLPPNKLPIELGGSDYNCVTIANNFLKAMQTDYWIKWFKASERKKTDESKRIAVLNNFEGDLGIMGSFRKLDID